MSENNSSKWGLIKKALYIWAVQYHFVIPKKILQGYIHKYQTESNNIAKYGKRFFDPSNDNEYKEWLSFQKYEDKKSELDITFIENSPVLELKDVHSEYLCIQSAKCHRYEVMDAYLDECRKYDVTYFDHDHIDENENRSDPQLKPDFSYDTLRGFNYIGNCWVARTEVLRQFDGQAWDPYRWLLELSDQQVSFGHISKILYGDQENEQNGLPVIQSYLHVHQFNAEAQQMSDGISVKVNYALSTEPLISIIIPTKDGREILDKCISSIIEKTTYKNYEIVIADNGSTKQETQDYFLLIQKKYKNIHVFDCTGPFNFSVINNHAVKEHTKGEYVVLLNNDVYVTTPDWLEQMLAYAQLKHIGSVGALLYYPDGSIQHAGVITGKGGDLGAHRYYRKPKDTVGYMHTLTIPNDVTCCTAACLMVPKKKYLEVNGMNEELAVQYNDVDLGIRLLAKGYFNVFLPDVKMVHDESKSRGIDKEETAVNRYLAEVEYAKKNYGEYIVHDPFYNDAFDKNYDYMLIAGKGSN